MKKKRKIKLVVLLIVMIILLMLAGCSKYVASKKPPKITERFIEGGVYVLAVCEDKVVCYGTEESLRQMSCIKDYTLVNKYCGIDEKEEQVNAS